MKSAASKVLRTFARVPPAAVSAAGLVYTLGLGWLDYVTPTGMSFTLFYVLGAVFVGWGAGRWPALLQALLAALVSQDWTAPGLHGYPAWMSVWNFSSRCLVLCSAGWLAAELSRLTSNLAKLVEQRTEEWKREAERHKATSDRLSETLDLNQKILAASVLGIVVYNESGDCVFANEALAQMAGGTVEQILNGNFRRLEGWKQSGLLQLAEAALSEGRVRSAECFDRTRFGKTVWVDAHMIPFVSNGQPHLLHMSYDITERKSYEARLNSIINGLPIMLLAVDQQGKVTFEDGRALRSLEVTPGEHVGQSVAEAYSRFPEILSHFRRALAGEEFSAEVDLGVASFLCHYSPTRDSNGTLTGYIGVATDTTERQLLQRQVLEISDREQARLGQEIHDGLCQQLVSLAFDANSLEQLTRGENAQAQTARRIAECLDQAITEARQLSRGLFPVRLESDGLGPALEELADTVSERFHVGCRFAAKEAAPMSTAMATHLYRIAQEAVNNSLRHGQAKNIEISLRADSAQLELTIEDDGTGAESHPPVAGKLTGMGLYIMDYRARSIGGTLRLGPGRSGGTAVSCCVPRLRSKDSRL
jgi:PAS domain S-box-containing protein